MFVVKHVVSRFGIGVSLSLLPIVSVVGFALLALDPVLGVVAVLDRGATCARISDSSKPTTDMLYSVVTPEEKYKTKNFIDTAVYRGGDVVGTWAVRLMSSLGIAGISVVMLPFAVLWAIVTLWLGRDYRRQARDLRQSGVI